MTSTSFHSSQSMRHEPLRGVGEAEPPAPDDNAVGLASPMLSDDHAAQVHRMRTFVGQRKFQAPVADDFSRGMLASGQPPAPRSQSSKRTGTALINDLVAWWRKQKAD
ncbi:hypothetical protein ACVWVP_004343 [Pseudomonas sp. TE24901]